MTTVASNARVSASDVSSTTATQPLSVASNVPVIRWASSGRPAGSASNVSTASESQGPTEVVVLTPSRLRVDSRVVISHSTAQWLTNSIFCICILLKLQGNVDWSWWLVFTPTWVNHALHIPLQVVILAYADHLIYKQIGPPPPVRATAGLHLQYSILRKTRLKSHIIDTINALIETTAMLVVKIVFCWMLDTGRLHSVSFRLLFTPFWVSWGITVFLSCLKDKSERMFGSTRDLLYIFFLFVAFKVDNQSSYSWRVVFLIPWMWFSALFLLAAMVAILLVFAHVWSRLFEMLLPVGFLCLLLSTVPQFVSYIELVKALDGNADDVNYQVILIPNAASWFCMWLSSIVLMVGLRQKERLREALLASGAVWTHHESVARRLYQDREAAQRKIDNLTEEEVAKLVEEMMSGKAKPGQLMRVGSTLYKRLTSFDGTATTEILGASEKTHLPDEQQDSSSAEICPETDGNTLRVQALGRSSSLSAVADAALQNVDMGIPGSSLQEETSCDLKTTPAVQGDVMELLCSGPSLFQQQQKDAAQPVAAPVRSEAHVEDKPSDDDLCVICYDNMAACVFLECGHGGFCRKCAHLLFVRPPNECPTCRTRIDQVVELQQRSKVGEITPVKL